MTRMARTYGRLGNEESEVLETIIAYALAFQKLAIAVADLSDDPVALQYAKRSHQKGQELQRLVLEYRGRRIEEKKKAHQRWAFQDAE